MRRKELLLRWIMILTAVVTMATFGTASYLGFLNYGDADLVTGNLDVSHFNLFHFFTHAHNGSYFPLAFLSYAAEASFFGIQASSFHLDNILIHVANSLLVLLLIFRISDGNFLVSAIGGILFAVYPVQVETVAWVSARPELLAAFFILLASHCYVRYTAPRGGGKNPFGGTYILCLSFFILAMLSNPASVVFPALLFLFDFQNQRKFEWKTFLEKIPFIATAAVFMTMNILIQGVNVTSDFQPALFVRNWATVWWPLNIFPFHRAMPISVSTPYLIAGTAGVFFLSFAAAFSERAKRAVIFGVGFFLVMILPDLHFMEPLGDKLAGNNIYLAIWGLLFSSAYIISGEAFENSKIRTLWRPVGISILVVLTATFSFFSHEKLRNWTNDRAVWQSVQEEFPGSPFAKYHEGLQRCSNGARPQGIYLLKKAAEVLPDSWRPQMALANCYRDGGMISEAFTAYEKASILSPENSEILLNRGIAHGQSGNLGQAIQDVKRAVGKNSDNSESYFKLASLYQRSGALDDAEAALQEGLDLDPKSAEGHHNLGNVYLDKNHLDQAALQFKLALEIDDKLPKTHFSLGNVYAALGLGDRAFEEYHRALEINPLIDVAHLNLGLLLLRTGKTHEAEREYREALQLNPKLAAAHRGLAEVYVKDGRDQDAEAERRLAQ